MRFLFSLFLFLLPWAVANAALPDNFADLPDDVQALLLEYEFYSDQANQVWGDDMVTPGTDSYVKYLDDYNSRAQVDFSRGLIRVETKAKDNPRMVLAHAISNTLLTPADPQQVDIYTAQEVGLSGKPFLLDKVKDHDGKAIEFPWRATRYAQYLIDHRLQKQGGRYWVDIPLVSQHRQIAARQYANPVNKAASRHQLDPALIYAVIQTESSFNPFAVSSSRAYGLMQVMPNTAGRDYFQRFRKKDIRPSRQYLFNANNNIEVGSGYLAILRDVYLKGIRDPLVQEYCIIAAYNGGAGLLLRSFHRDKKRAIARINSLSANQVYRHITQQHPKKESRRYLEKVMRYKQQYL